MHTVLREIIFWTWCLPQSIVGALVFIVFKASSRVHAVSTHKGVTLVQVYGTLGGLALGKFIFVSEENTRKVNQEYGHTLQNFIFGPVYLVVIGLPSLFWFICSRWSRRVRESYFDRYPENWADTLGKVKRK